MMSAREGKEGKEEEKMKWDETQSWPANAEPSQPNPRSRGPSRPRKPSREMLGC